MHKTFISLLILCFITVSEMSGQHICGGIIGDTDAFNQRLKANVKSAKKIKHLKSSQETVFIPIKFHLVADSDGIGRLNFSLLLDELCILNEQFESLGIQFYLKDGINSFDHTPTYEAPRKAGAIAKIVSEINKVGTEAVNVIISQNADLVNPDFGTTLGYYSQINDYVVVRKNEIGKGGSTMVHELGHLFSLNHPHYGWEDEPWNIEVHGKTVTKQTVSSSQSTGSVKVELVDRSNCEDSGDFICDTPPDYNFGFSWDRACPRFRTVVLDRNADTIVPMQNNYMSYFLGCDPYAFTQDQANVIIADVGSNKRSNLISNYVPNENQIVDETELISPANNTTADFFNGIELVWKDVEHADSYYLNITGGGDDFRIITDQPTYFMTELAPNAIYTWSVTPFNETGGCAEKKTSILRTNDVETFTVDPAIDGSITISPNPSFKGDNLRVNINSEEAISASYLVTALDGRTLLRKAMNINQGVNTLNINMENYSSGVYLFSIVSDKGVTTQKLIIQ